MNRQNQPINREQQIELQKIVQAKQARKAELFEQILNTETFPMAKLSESWKWKALRAIKMCSPLSQRIGLKDFLSVIEADVHEKVTLFQFGVLSNCIEAVSMDDLNCTSTEEYASLIKESLEHIEYYQKRVAKIREEIEQNVEQEFLMKHTTEKGLKPVANA